MVINDVSGGFCLGRRVFWLESGHVPRAFRSGPGEELRSRVGGTKSRAEDGALDLVDFPPAARAGTSEYSVFYGLADQAEAKAYLAHPVLGAHYRECVAVVHRHLCEGGVVPLTLMGSEIDVVKLRSSLGLFGALAAGRAGAEFRQQCGELLKVLPKA